MANFFHLLTGEQRMHANEENLEERLEKTCLDNDVFELPATETVCFCGLCGDFVAFGAFVAFVVLLL